MKRAFFGTIACSLVLGGCLFGDDETSQQAALKAYTGCLRKAASKLDDGEGDAETVAKVISPFCSAEFQNVVRANNTENKKEFEVAMQPKQIDFAADVVRDRRKLQPSN